MDCTSICVMFYRFHPRWRSVRINRFCEEWLFWLHRGHICFWNISCFHNMDPTLFDLSVLINCKCICSVVPPTYEEANTDVRYCTVYCALSQRFDFRFYTGVFNFSSKARKIRSMNFWCILLVRLWSEWEQCLFE